MVLSPLTWPPSSSCACSTTSSSVEGSTRPRTLSTCVDSRTACSKSPVTSESAAMKRLPKLWPCRPPPSGKRYWKSRLIMDSSSASATRQLRRSPGGGMPMSRRSRPELPPSSAIVTTAVRLLVCDLSPRSRAARPLPPPTATTRGPRARRLAARISLTDSGVVRWKSQTRRPPYSSANRPTATPSTLRSSAAQCRFSSHPIPKSAHELRRPEHADAEDDRVDQQHAAGERQQDPALEPEARGEPLQRSAHRPGRLSLG